MVLTERSLHPGDMSTGESSGPHGFGQVSEQAVPRRQHALRQPTTIKTSMPVWPLKQHLEAIITFYRLGSWKDCRRNEKPERPLCTSNFISGQAQRQALRAKLKKH